MTTAATMTTTTTKMTMDEVVAEEVSKVGNTVLAERGLGCARGGTSNTVGSS
jgi:hypothetical protein